MATSEEEDHKSQDKSQFLFCITSSSSYFFAKTTRGQQLQAIQHSYSSLFLLVIYRIVLPPHEDDMLPQQHSLSTNSSPLLERHVPHIMSLPDIRTASRSAPVSRRPPPAPHRGLRTRMCRPPHAMLPDPPEEDEGGGLD